MLALVSHGEELERTGPVSFLVSRCPLCCEQQFLTGAKTSAADASTDVIFNAGSIAFPIVGYWARVWWLDALGGLLLSGVVIYNWSQTSYEHIRHLSGFSATADQRNIRETLTTTPCFI